MAIANVVQRGSMLYVYDERGRQLAVVSAGDRLQGYTSTSFSVRRGSMIYTYNEAGRQISVISAR